MQQTTDFAHTTHQPPVAGAGGTRSPIPWGARWGPSRSQVPSDVIKRAHTTRLGRPLGVGSLAPPRATPRLGGATVSCQCLPCSFVLALRELGLRLGVKAPLPLRASSRGVLPGAGALAGYRTPIQPVCFTKAAAPKSKPIRVMHLVALRSPPQKT
jgi:hypothetical protein